MWSNSVGRCHRLVVPNVRKAFIYVVVIANQRRKLLKIVAYWFSNSRCSKKYCYIDDVFLYSAPIHWLVHGHMTCNNDAKCHERATSRKLWRQTGNNSLLPSKCWPLLTWSQVAWCCRWNLSAFFKICFCFVLLYNKSLNDWFLWEQLTLYPSNLNIFIDFSNSRETKLTVPLGTSH